MIERLDKPYFYVPSENTLIWARFNAICDLSNVLFGVGTLTPPSVNIKNVTATSTIPEALTAFEMIEDYITSIHTGLTAAVEQKPEYAGFDYEVYQSDRPDWTTAPPTENKRMIIWYWYDYINNILDFFGW